MSKYVYKSQAQRLNELRKNHFRVRYVCEKCAHVKMMSWFEYLPKFVFQVFVCSMAIMGMFAYYSILTLDVDKTSDMLAFSIIEDMSTTKMEQMNQMATKYSTDPTIIALATSTVYVEDEQINMSLWQRAVIYHQFINSNTIYQDDNIYGNHSDVLLSPLITLSNGGDCEDRTVAFLALAKAGGLECYPALTTGHAFAYCAFPDSGQVVFFDSSFDRSMLNVFLIDTTLRLYNLTYAQESALEWSLMN